MASDQTTDQNSRKLSRRKAALGMLAAPWVARAAMIAPRVYQGRILFARLYQGGKLVSRARDLNGKLVWETVR